MCWPGWKVVLLLPVFERGRVMEMRFEVPFTGSRVAFSTLDWETLRWMMRRM